jgi:hypothetical protein
MFNSLIKYRGSTLIAGSLMAVAMGYANLASAGCRAGDEDCACEVCPPAEEECRLEQVCATPAIGEDNGSCSDKACFTDNFSIDHLLTYKLGNINRCPLDRPVNVLLQDQFMSDNCDTINDDTSLTSDEAGLHYYLQKPSLILNPVQKWVDKFFHGGEFTDIHRDVCAVETAGHYLAYPLVHSRNCRERSEINPLVRKNGIRIWNQFTTSDTTLGSDTPATGADGLPMLASLDLSLVLDKHDLPIAPLLLTPANKKIIRDHHDNDGDGDDDEASTIDEFFDPNLSPLWVGDHYTCYEVKPNKRFFNGNWTDRLRVHLRDQFQVLKKWEVGAPKHVCVPTVKRVLSFNTNPNITVSNPSGIVEGTENDHLVCYKVTPKICEEREEFKGQKDIFTRDQFQDIRDFSAVGHQREQELCVPSRKCVLDDCGSCAPISSFGSQFEGSPYGELEADPFDKCPCPHCPDSI